MFRRNPHRGDTLALYIHYVGIGTFMQTGSGDRSRELIERRSWGRERIATPLLFHCAKSETFHSSFVMHVLCTVAHMGEQPSFSNPDVGIVGVTTYHISFDHIPPQYPPSAHVCMYRLFYAKHC